ncbi:hypothetical protein RYA05_04590 [Pseudomonas syringae pv. actinidiae]|nr:hypothetical protein [Pseudomonas syringae pv. actinidiae]
MPSNHTVAKIACDKAGTLLAASSLIIRMSHDQLEVLGFSDDGIDVGAVKKALTPLYTEVNEKLAGKFYFFSFIPRFGLASLEGLIGMINRECTMPEFSRLFDGVAESLKQSDYAHNVEFSLGVRPQGYPQGSTFAIRSYNRQEPDNPLAFNVIAEDPEVLLAQQCFNPDHPVIADISEWYSVFMGTFFMRWDSKTQDYATPQSHPVAPHKP